MRRTPFARVLLKAERVRCPRAERDIWLLSRFGHHARRHHDRRGRCFPWTGTGGRAGRERPRSSARSSPLFGGLRLIMRPCRVPRKPGLKLSETGESTLSQEPWWNADRRARSDGRALHRRMGRANRVDLFAPMRTGRTVRLSAFRFLCSFVVASQTEQFKF